MKKCNLISFGKTNKFILLVFVGAILYFALTFTEGESKFFAEENFHPIIYNITYNLGLCLSFLLYIIYNIRNKGQTNTNTNKINLVLTEGKESLINPTSHGVKQITKKEKFLLILFVSIIDFIASIFESIFWINVDNYINTWTINMIFLTLFSHFILKMKLYKHHFLCITTNIIIGILFNVLSGRLSIDSIKKYYHFYLVSILTTGLYNLTYVLEKYYMFFKYIKSYEILFSEGIIELFLSIVTLIITTNIGYIDNFWDYWENLDGNEIVIFFVLTLIYFLDYTLILSVLDIFTPFHVFLITIVSEIILFFYNIDKMNIIVAILSFILLILDTFMILVFIELLELNFCDLSKMTGKNIELRARIDSLNDDKIFDKEVTFGEYELEIKDDQEIETDLTERGTIN